jgi:radical SAM protein with 4Fe4S-binding SPASM domain
MDNQIKRLKQWQRGKKPAPIGIELAPTLRCNLNCDFCWRKEVKDIDYSNELSLDLYARLIEEAKGLGVKEVKIIGGGEATTRKDILQIMQLIKENSMYGYLCTNGTLFNEGFVKELVKIDWDYIKISFHGPKEIHNSLVNDNKAYDKIINMLNLFRKYKIIYKKKLPEIEFGFVLVNKNYKNLIEVVELANKYQIDSVFVEPITVYSEVGIKLKLNKKEQKEFIGVAKNAYELANKYGLNNNFKDFFDSNLIENTNIMNKSLTESTNPGSLLTVPCYEPWLRMGIRVDGLVGPCGFFDEKSMENIKNKSLKEIWYGDYFDKRRKQMLTNNLPEYCKKCCTTLVSNNQRIREKLK